MVNKISTREKIQEVPFWRMLLFGILGVAAAILLSRQFPWGPFLTITATIVCSSLLLTRFTAFYEEMRMR
ncbi:MULTISPECIES: hypothetical protein [Enterococcus]|uniref:hypothetical protein n=1 Tax=unclassified Enterococcus TaxID=2608891 RepID=UPI001E46A453|nr:MULTISPECIES: hypothetical protein [Enterococcus]